MKAHGKFAAHNVVEAKTTNGWAVLDPLFDVYFIKPNSGLASFADVQGNWDYYKKQLPSNYDFNYRYEDVRYSNWGKIPLILPAAKKVLDFVLGKEKADAISLRVYFLKMYDFYFMLTLILYIPVFILTLRKLIKTKIFPQPNIPLTPANIIKYSKVRLINKQMNSGIDA